MKKPEDQEPKDITEEEELTEEETDEVSGGVLSKESSTLGITPGCDCKKGQGGTEDWSAVG